MSWKQICDRYGQEEAASRVRAGTLKAKRDPEDKRFWLFMSVQETAKDSMNRVKKARVSTNTKLDRKTGANLQQALAHGACRVLPGGGGGTVGRLRRGLVEHRERGWQKSCGGRIKQGTDQF